MSKAKSLEKRPFPRETRAFQAFLSKGIRGATMGAPPGPAFPRPLFPLCVGADCANLCEFGRTQVQRRAKPHSPTDRGTFHPKTGGKHVSSLKSQVSSLHVLTTAPTCAGNKTALSAKLFSLSSRTQWLGFVAFLCVFFGRSFRKNGDGPAFYGPSIFVNSAAPNKSKAPQSHRPRYFDRCALPTPSVRQRREISDNFMAERAVVFF